MASHVGYVGCTEHREMLQTSLVVDASDLGGPQGISRSEAMDSDDEETRAGSNHGASTVPSNPSSSPDSGPLSTLGMIILSYSKNDPRVAINIVRQGKLTF